MAWLLPLVPMVGGFACFLPGRNWSRLSLGLFAVVTALACLLLACIAVAANWGGSYVWSEMLVLELSVTPLSAVFLITVPAVAAAVIGFAASHEPRGGLARLLALLLVFTGAMELLVLAEDFLTLLIAWEVVGACSWALINHEWNERGNAEDAGWAFLVTRLGDLGLFVAAFVLFSSTGSFSFDYVGALDPATLSLFTAALLTAAAAKSAQFPFAPWLFSAMAGPAPVSALLHAATMVAAGVYILVRLHESLAAVSWFQPVVMTLGLVTVFLSGLVAITQFHAKKLLAASTASHYGLMLVAVGAGYPGIAALHFMAHAAMKASLFLIAGAAGKASGSYDLRNMGLGRKLPKAAVASLISCLALAGLFPLGAGWTKEKIVTAAGHVTPWLAVTTMIVGAFGAAYAVRFHRHAFARKGGDSAADSRESVTESAAIYLLVLLTIVVSLLWLPSVAHAVEGILGKHFPAFKAWELVGSLGLVVIAGSIGFWLARRAAPLESKAARFTSEWFGIPQLAFATVMRPVVKSSSTLARFDDQVLDRMPSLVESGAGWLTVNGSRWSESLLEKAIATLTAGTLGLAQWGSRVSEDVFDQLPGTLARGAGKAGRLARQLQTGMSHQYYTLAALGLLTLIVILILGGTF